MKRIAKHIREAIRAAGVKPDSIGHTARGHYLLMVNGIAITMAGSPGDYRSMKNAISEMKRAAKC